jgi:hypothetical protein
MLAILVLLLIPALPPASNAQGDSYTFPQTGKTVRGKFLRYWLSHGGTPQQGLPISEEMQERSDTDDKIYTVQYFERAIFELHPDNQPPYDVLLSLLGVFRYKEKYPDGAPGQGSRVSPTYQLFSQTGKRVGCEFIEYWNTHGGVAQQGYPISDELTEVSDLDGREYRVQYFERAVFELHPENEPESRVLLSQLGTFRYRAKHAGQAGTPAGTPQPSPTPIPGKCVATLHGGSFSEGEPDAPARSSVGTGHVTNGTVKAESDCTPIAGAKVVYWLAGPNGEYDDDHQGSVFTDASGAYTFETNFPGRYGGRPIPHIHIFVKAEGYLSLETEFFPVCGETQATLNIVLAPRAGQPTPGE